MKQTARRDETAKRAVPAPLHRGGPLDALRFLAAFCMVVYHYAPEAPTALDRLHPVFGRGYLATDFFLIVSGYVLGRIYGGRVAGGRMSSVEFFLRRASRVVPAHLLVSGAFVGLVLVSGWAGLKPLHPEWFDWAELPAQLALVQSWGLVMGGKGWNAPTWTLSALLVCYLAFPVLWRGLGRIASPVAVLALGVGLFALANGLSGAALGYPVYELPLRYGVIRAAPLFLIGVTLAFVAERIVIPATIARIVALVGLALLVLVQAVGRFDLLSLALIAVTVLAAGAVPVRKRSHLLERAALVSFALFITNEWVRLVYFGLVGAAGPRIGLGADAGWAVWFGGLATAVIFAVGFHYLVDWPSQGWIKAKLTRASSLKTTLARHLPRPDPEFDPAAARAEPREILLNRGLSFAVG